MKKIISDAWVIGQNELLIQVRNPLWLFFGLFQPIVYLLLFAPFLSGIANAPGFPSENALQFFVPGLLIMNALFGAGFSGFGLIDKLRSGFVERIRVTPVNRISIVLGLVLSAPVVLIIQSAILVVVAFFMGFTADFWGMHLEVLLMLLVALAMGSISYTIALMVRDEGTLAAITNFFTLPLMLLSGIMLPIAFAPKFIQNIAKADPFLYAVDASRALINGDILNSSVAIAFILFGILTIATFAWFVRAMKDAVA